MRELDGLFQQFRIPFKTRLMSDFNSGSTDRIIFETEYDNPGGAQANLVDWGPPSVAGEDAGEGIFVSGSITSIEEGRKGLAVSGTSASRHKQNGGLHN